MKPPDFGFYASTITTTPKPPSTSSGKSESISPLQFRKFKPITALRLGHSSPGIFLTSASRTATSLQDAPR